MNSNYFKVARLSLAGFLCHLFFSCDGGNFNGGAAGDANAGSKITKKSVTPGSTDENTGNPDGIAKSMDVDDGGLTTFVCGDKRYRVDADCVNAVPFYRWYSSKYGDHFYSTVASQACEGKTRYAIECGGNGSQISGETVNEGGYHYEGVGFWALPPKYKEVNGLVKFYRLYNSNTGKHFYTSRDAEKTAAEGRGFVLEGNYQIFPIAQKYTKPIYQWYSDTTQDNFYSFAAGSACAGKKSSDPNCGGETVNEGSYRYMGIAGYLFPE